MHTSCQHKFISTTVKKNISVELEYDCDNHSVLFAYAIEIHGKCCALEY